MRKRKRKLAAALGFVASTGVLGGGDGTFGNFAAYGDEASAGRPLVVEPRDGKLAKPSAYKAFLVAADDYGDAANPLPGAKNDVKALKARLESLGFATTVLETGGSFQNFPMKTIIERRFKRFVADLRPGDFALVYLSGHGLQPFDSEESYFAPVDVDVKDLFGSSVSINEMLDALKASDATFRWVIVDACRDDPLNSADNSAASAFKSASKSLGAKSLGKIASVPDSVALLQSCEPGKCSYEGGEKGAEDIKNGFFTLSLLEALDDKDSKADADRDGALTFTETFQYVSKRTDELAHKSYGVTQIPSLSGSIVDFALLDGLLIDGITKAEWDKAENLFQEARELRKQKRWRDALAKICAAREINKKREEYATAEEEICYLVDNENGGEAGELANEAVAAFESEDYATAIRKMEASLKLNDAPANRLLLAQFKERLAQEKNPQNLERLAKLALTAFESGEPKRINEALEALAALATKIGLQYDENSEAAKNKTEGAESTPNATKGGRLSCGSKIEISCVDALLLDARRRLDKVAGIRAKLIIAMANSGSDSNHAAEALDKALEELQETLRRVVADLERLSVEYRTMRDKANKSEESESR